MVLSFKKLALCLLFIPFITTNANTQPAWVNPSGKDVQTIVYQGMNCSATQFARYAGNRGFIASTGEKIINPHGIDIIENVYAKPEIDEVIPASTAPFTIKDITLNPAKILSGVYTKILHGATRLAGHYYGNQVIPNVNSDKTIAAYSLDIGKINVGQEGDLASHAKRFEQCQKEHPDADLIFMGVSRGAATTCQAIVNYFKTGKDLSKTKLVVLEGCFDSVPEVLKKRHPWLLSTEKMMNIANVIASKIIAFKKDGPAPIKVVQDFPKHIPVAFITSEKDKEVPAENTQRVVQKLVAAGHSNVYLLVLKNSSHPKYMMDDEKDKTNYTNFMHALYKKYDLPHIPEYAQAGKELVEHSKIA